MSVIRRDIPLMTVPVDTIAVRKTISHMGVGERVVVVVKVALLDE